MAKMQMHDTFRPGAFAAVSRLLLCTLQAGFRYLSYEYDSSSVEQSFLSHQMDSEYSLTHLNDSKTIFDKMIMSALGGLSKWDAVYFLNIASLGYDYEQMLAFFPAFPCIVSYLAKVFEIICLGFINHLSCLMLCGALINMLAFSIAAISLHKLTLKMTRNNGKADVTVILFCCNPANIFHVAAYSESLFACFQFTGMLWIEERNERSAFLVSALCFAGATATRSNGLLSVGFLLYALLIKILFIFTRKQDSFWNICFCYAKEILINFLTCGASVLIVLVPFLVFQYFAFVNYCQDVTKLKDSKAHWCLATFPSSYSYIQKTYWNVGPFRYFQWKQIPNFALALPVIFLSFGASWNVLKLSSNGLWTLLQMIVDNQQTSKRRF
ncbi:GPI mannosyltransferase 2-like isoform X2 [Rhopilema esculentum]|uniref:GPI mannosyltransferase 2-like isoform X2 n=1 Tax=Rhopilema esculentum TaxID=499914 RepID=UPI0031CEFA8F